MHPSPTPTTLSFSRPTRDARLEQLADVAFDLLIFGAGLVGAAVARDAAMRGLRVALFDRGDLAGGATWSASGLVGAPQDLRLADPLSQVAALALERHRLQLIGPHIFESGVLLSPTWERQPAPLWRTALRASTYRGITRTVGAREPGRRLGAEAAMGIEPELRSGGLDGALLGAVSWADPVRLTLAVARAAHDTGAWVLPYTEVVGLCSARRQVTGLQVRDLRSGREIEAQGDVVLLAAGPWQDRLRGLRGARPRVVWPSRSVELVVSAASLPITVPVELREAGLLVRTVGDRTRVIGLDAPHAGSFDDPSPTADEVLELLDRVNAAFPGAGLDWDDILAIGGGLRPRAAPPADERLGRDGGYTVQRDPDGLISVSGGDLLGHRLQAARAVSTVRRALSEHGVQLGRCPTASVLLPGARGIGRDVDGLFPTTDSARAAYVQLRDRVGEDAVYSLLRRHGDGWREVAARIADEPDGGERLHPELPLLRAEVDYSVDHELVTTLRDFTRRRTDLERLHPARCIEAAPEIAWRIGDRLGWSEAIVHLQVSELRKALEAASPAEV